MHQISDTKNKLLFCYGRDDEGGGRKKGWVRERAREGEGNRQRKGKGRIRDRAKEG